MPHCSKALSQESMRSSECNTCLVMKRNTAAAPHFFMHPHAHACPHKLPHPHPRQLNEYVCVVSEGCMYPSVYPASSKYLYISLYLCACASGACTCVAPALRLWGAPAQRTVTWSLVARLMKTMPNGRWVLHCGERAELNGGWVLHETLWPPCHKNSVDVPMSWSWHRLSISEPVCSSKALRGSVAADCCFMSFFGGVTLRVMLMSVACWGSTTVVSNMTNSHVAHGT
jgi:hypothetical protein